jgi:SCP-2 sterol transfer family
MSRAMTTTAVATTKIKEEATPKSDLSVVEITTAMADAVRYDGDKLRKKFNAIVQFDIDGTTSMYDLRDVSSSYQPINESSSSSSSSLLSSSSTNVEKADLIVTTSLRTLQDMFQKKLTPQQAYKKGKLKLIGKITLAMKLQIVLESTFQQLKQNNPRSRL